MINKNYIFLNTTIAGVGGAEIYISKKCRHLKSLGYYVFVVSFESGEIIINDLREFEKYMIPELKIPIRRSNTIIRKNILRHFNNLKLNGMIIIESNTNNLNGWGEFIAKEIGAFHICYLLPELNNLIKCDYDFYAFKYKQHCLYGIKSQTVPNLMGDGKEYPNTYLPAVGCSIEVVSDEISIDVSGIAKADFSILSLGRLNKPYIPFMLESVYEFFQKHRGYTINLIIIGGYLTQNIEKKISKIQSISPNLNIYYLGELYPIPRQIFQLCDVSIAVAGCARICDRQGLPNIVIDAKDYKGIGVYNYTTKNSIFRSIEKPTNVSSLLEDVLVKKIFKKRPPQIDVSSVQLDYSKHDALLDVPAEYEYFNISYRPESFLAYCVKVLISLIGYKIYFKIIDFLRKSTKSSN